jgi:Fe-S cluster assembly protein SufD
VPVREEDAMTSPAVDTFTMQLAEAAVAEREEPAFVADLRRRGRDLFLSSGVPTPRHEEWRFTNLKAIADTTYRTVAADRGAEVPWRLEDAVTLVFVNGRFAPELSNTDAADDGLTVTPIARALDERPGLIEPWLGRRLPLEDHPFAAFNSATFVDGAFIHVGRDAVIERPVHLVFLAAGDGSPSFNAPRTLVVAEPGAQLSIVEQYAGPGGDTLTIPVTEFHVGQNAIVRHVRLQEEARDAAHVAVQHAWIDRDATLDSVAVNLGGRLARTDVDAVIDGEGAHATLNGLYLVEDEQHTDTQLRVRHARPHGTSHELYKGILDGGGRSVFNGRIVVDPGAQKTDAVQSNRNLLLSDRALAYSNPQLEIFADDVRCTHGSTVGRLDDDAVFYLRSRGLDEAAATSLLTYAFAAEVVQSITVDPVRERLERFLFERLPQGDLVKDAF